LDVTLTKGAGATDAFIMIDLKGVPIGADNKGVAKVDPDDPLHDIQVVVRGQHPATCDFKVMQGAVQLAGGTLTVSFGKRVAGYVDEFSHV
jgi:hypothetical protein